MFPLIHTLLKNYCKRYVSYILFSFMTIDKVSINEDQIEIPFTVSISFVHLFTCVFNNFIQLSYFLCKLKKPKTVMAINVKFVRQTSKALRRKPHIISILHMLNGTVLQRTYITVYTSCSFLT